MSTTHCTSESGYFNIDLSVSSFVSVGSHHACAIVNGGAKCWGMNSNGELGDGSTMDRGIPIDVDGLSKGVSDISAELEHTCAVVNGAAMCWGNGLLGRLGFVPISLPTIMRETPTRVEGLGSGVSDISVGSYQTCAVVDEGVKCWGHDTDGVLGDGPSSVIPGNVVDVEGLGPGSGVSAVSLGNLHACAIVNGGAKCWGRNNFGQLGDDSTVNSSIPVGVDGLSEGVSVISAGYQYTCAVHRGAAKCWGNNGFGQLGDGSTVDSSPVDVDGLSEGVSAISASYSHSCAVHRGAAKCWGNNASAELGNGHRWSVLRPAFVLGLRSGVKSISAGFGLIGTSCAIHKTSLKCWGKGILGVAPERLESPPNDFFIVPGRVYFNLQ